MHALSGMSGLSGIRGRSGYTHVSLGLPVSQGQFSASYDEISDLATPGKVANDNYLWAVDDGLLDRVIAFNKATAAVAGEWTITGFTGLDVECMCSFTVGGQPYLVIGDTGNNANAADSRAAGVDMRLARVKEPTVTGSNGTIGAPDVEIINCAFPGANIPSHRDVECILADPAAGHIYVITKRITPVLIYRLPYAASYAGTQTLEYLGQISGDSEFNTISTTPSTNNGYVVGGCVSPDGTDIILRSYFGFYGWKRTPAQTIAQALTGAQHSSKNLEITIGKGLFRISPFGEPQGEACCFSRDGNYLYHTSEYVAASAFQQPPLFRTPRVDKALTRVTFQQGFSSYSGCTDTYLNQAVPGTSNATSTTLIADYDYSAYPTTSNVRMGLLKFNISAIPSSATIVAAFLDLYCGAEGVGAQLHRMLISWNDASTWTSLTNGVSLNGVDAVAAASVILGDATGESAFLDTKLGFMRFPLPVSDVQGWVSGTFVNEGYAITGRATDTTGDGMQFNSSKDVTNTDRRPKLTVLYHT